MAAAEQAPAKQLFAGSGPFALDDTLRPKDPAAYRQALLDNPQRMHMVRLETHVVTIQCRRLCISTTGAYNQAGWSSATS